MSSTQSQFVVWQEMLPGDDGLISPMLQNQYDVLYGSWPKNYDEVVLIVDENNEVSDMVLYALGLTLKPTSLRAARMQARRTTLRSPCIEINIYI